LPFVRILFCNFHLPHRVTKLCHYFLFCHDFIMLTPVSKII
jgi:hypothetical protein